MNKQIKSKTGKQKKKHKTLIHQKPTKQKHNNEKQVLTAATITKPRIGLDRQIISIN